MDKKELIPFGIVLLTILIAVYIYPLLPARVPIHWNAAGEVDNYGSKLLHTLLFPGIIVFIYVLFQFIPKIEVFRKNLQSFMKYFYIMKVTVMSFMFYIFVLTTLPNFGFDIKFNILLMPALGVMFMIIGYTMRFAKRNFFVGFRTPWTLASDKVWKKTHELGSKFFMIIGGWIAISGFFPTKYFLWYILVPVIGLLIWTFVYSYLLYKKESKGFKKEPKL